MTAGNLNRPRIARGGILIVGDGVTAARVARELGEVTLVASNACTSADFDRRVVEVASDVGLEAIAYAELVIAAQSDGGRLASRLGLPLGADGRILTDEILRVPGFPHVWVLGKSTGVDAAALSHRLAL